MIAAYLQQFILPAAYAVLPDAMRGLQADAMLLAIALQESDAANRRQHGNGPARGFWQFERTGLTGVLRHHATRHPCGDACARLGYARDLSTADAYAAIEHNDVLACVFARLLLWTLPQPLPTRGEVLEAYAQYLDAWRPGKPRPNDWPGNYAYAWAMVSPVED